MGTPSTLACVVWLSLATGFLACKRDSPPEPTTPTPSPASASPHGGNPHGGGGHGAPHELPTPERPAQPLQWTDPPGWERQAPSNPMRFAQYRLPGAGGQGPAELTVSTFGTNAGGSVQENLQRWQGQISPGPDAGAPTAPVVLELSGGLKATIVEYTGELRAGPMQAGSTGPGALLGAVVEGPAGLWFFKATGPAGTVHAARPGLETLLRSLH